MATKTIAQPAVQKVRFSFRKLITILVVIFVIAESLSFLVLRADIEIKESLERATITATTHEEGCEYKAEIRGYGYLLPFLDENPCSKLRMLAWYAGGVKKALAEKLNELGFNGNSIAQEILISLLLYP